MTQQLTKRFIMFCVLLSVQVFSTSYLIFSLVLQDEKSQVVALLVFLFSTGVIMAIVVAMAGAMARLSLEPVAQLAERVKSGLDKQDEVDESLPGAPELEEILRHYNQMVRQWKAAQLEMFLIGGIFDELHRIKNDDSPFQVFRLLNRIMDGLKSASHFDRLMVLLREDGQLAARLAIGYASHAEGAVLGFGAENPAVKGAFTGRCMMKLETPQAVTEGLGEYVNRFGEAACAVVVPMWNRGEIMGFFVADTATGSPLDEARLHALLVLSNFLGFTFEKLEILRQIRNLANFDETTHAYNRKYFLARMEEEVKKAGRYKQEFSLLMVKASPYHHLVKNQGFEKGEDLARLVASYVMAHVREVDLLCRYQEDTFLLLLPATGDEGGSILAGRLQEGLQGMVRLGTEDGALPVVVSRATFPHQGATIDALLHKLMLHGDTSGP